jgi:hypothetical protein
MLHRRIQVEGQRHIRHAPSARLAKRISNVRRIDKKITLTGGGDPVSVILVDWIAGRRSASQSISEERWEEERASSEFFSMGGSERECFRRHLMIGI